MEKEKNKRKRQGNNKITKVSGGNDIFSFNLEHVCETNT